MSPVTTPATQKTTPMTDSELDAVYTNLCKTMTQLGESQSSMFLARFALLAINHIADAETTQQLIAAAAEDLTAAAHP
jgi:Protein of unknown function (DUF2783)